MKCYTNHRWSHMYFNEIIKYLQGLKWFEPCIERLCLTASTSWKRLGTVPFTNVLLFVSAMNGEKMYYDNCLCLLLTTSSDMLISLSHSLRHKNYIWWVWRLLGYHHHLRVGYPLALSTPSTSISIGIWSSIPIMPQKNEANVSFVGHDEST